VTIEVSDPYNVGRYWRVNMLTLVLLTVLSSKVSGDFSFDVQLLSQTETALTIGITLENRGEGTVLVPKPNTFLLGGLLFEEATGERKHFYLEGGSIYDMSYYPLTMSNAVVLGPGESFTTSLVLEREDFFPGIPGSGFNGYELECWLTYDPKSLVNRYVTDWTGMILKRNLTAERV
jgi:hypothetical protein